jgi:hypothetical protein
MSTTKLLNIFQRNKWRKSLAKRASSWRQLTVSAPLWWRRSQEDITTKFPDTIKRITNCLEASKEVKGALFHNEAVAWDNWEKERCYGR